MPYCFVRRRPAIQGLKKIDYKEEGNVLPERRGKQTLRRLEGGKEICYKGGTLGISVGGRGIAKFFHKKQLIRTRTHLLPVRVITPEVGKKEGKKNISAERLSTRLYPLQREEKNLGWGGSSL